MSWGYEDLRRVLALFEDVWDIDGFHADSTGGGRQNMMIKFKRKPREEEAK